MPVHIEVGLANNETFEAALAVAGLARLVKMVQCIATE